jgi:hypothetical protein
MREYKVTGYDKETDLPIVVYLAARSVAHAREKAIERGIMFPQVVLDD